MPSRHQDDFELVLGNKQLLSLFFFVVVLFAVFFAFGYTVGFDRGQQERVETVARTETPPEPEPRIPDALLENGPQTTLSEGPGTAPPRVKVSKPPPRPRAAAPSARRKAAVQPAARKPAPRNAPTGAQVARSIHIQVAAIRVRSDARMMVNKLRSRQYPVTLHDQGGDGWYRVLVGPFPDVAAAKKQQQRLKSDGFDTILRK